METLLRDIHYGFRMLQKSPSFTAVAVIALALGIGANTAIFSIVNAVLLQPLPYPQPDRMVMVWGERANRGKERPLSAPDFEDLRSQNHVFQEMATFDEAAFVQTGIPVPERLLGMSVSPGFFGVVGVKPLLGRVFSATQDKPDARLAVLSHRLWLRKYGNDTSIAGKVLVLNGEPYSVVGVMPDSFNFFDDRMDVVATPPYSPEMLKHRGAHFLLAVGRLKPGVSSAQAEAEMKTIARRLEQQYPNTNQDTTVYLKSMREQLVGDIRLPLIILLSAVGLVVLIACANVANLLLARAASRQKELALRAAIGASRGSLISQLLTESIILGLCGGLLGLALAYWGLDAVIRLWGEQLPRSGEIAISLPVLAFTLSVSVLTGLLFGMAPALHAANPNLYDALKESGRSASAGRRSQKIRNLLVAGELAVALVLVIGAGLLIKSFLHLQAVNPGFIPQNLSTVSIHLPDAKYYKPEQQRNLASQFIQRVAAIPGVESAALAAVVPMGGNSYSFSFNLVEHPLPEGQQNSAAFNAVTPGYFRTMQIPLLRGRVFGDQDTESSLPVVVVSQRFAQRYFADEDPIGRKVTNLGFDRDKSRAYEVIGVVGDIKTSSLDGEFQPMLYAVFAQSPWQGFDVIIRSQLDQGSLASTLTHELQSLDKDQPILRMHTLFEYMSDSVARQRLNMLLLGIFAGLALLLASVGIYGVMSYVVAQRTQEFGIRMALGAQQKDLLRLVLGHASQLALGGLAVGVVAAFALTRVLRSLLFEVKPTDPLIFVGLVAGLTCVALLASYLPARRATRVDPMVALHYE